MSSDNTELKHYSDVQLTFGIHGRCILTPLWIWSLWIHQIHPKPLFFLFCYSHSLETLHKTSYYILRHRYAVILLEKKISTLVPQNTHFSHWEKVRLGAGIPQGPELKKEYWLTASLVLLDHQPASIFFFSFIYCLWKMH